MLESITIKNVATYDSKGVAITDLKKVNFIYGANGCGKTTITKYLDKADDQAYTSCCLKWRGGSPVKALVYNKDFRDKNFGRGKIDGVFTLGQATKEEIESIEQMRLKLEDLKKRELDVRTALDKQVAEKEKLEDEFKEQAWSEIYKKNETEFKEAFVGFMKKETFKAKVLEEFSTNVSIASTLEELKTKAKIIFGRRPTELKYITSLDFSRLLEIELNAIWKRKILGKADVSISDLIQRLNMNDWVNAGREYIQEDDLCPFCQQKTLTDQFKKQLEEYFDESFTHDTSKIKSLKDDYNRVSQNVLNILAGIENNEKANSESKLKIDEFTSLLKTLSLELLSNRELQDNKIKEPSRSIELFSTKEQLEHIQQLIDSCNKNIKSHNDIVHDYDRQKHNLIRAIWKYLVHNNSAMIANFYRKFEGLQKGVSILDTKYRQLQNDYKELNKKIKEANKNVTSIQPSIDEINRILRSFGFVNFEIVPSKVDANQYQILRQDGNIAETTLSEGETTFITFLYYLQLAKGSTQQELITEERILVIDDPISSLDSTVLFVISSLIKEIIKEIKDNRSNIKQLILLTHNIYFHKEVSFIDGRQKKNGNTNFWILRRKNCISSIQAYGMDNPIQSSYELLWGELKNSENNSFITIQNIMRRILENYFKILGNYADDALINSFDDYQEKEICRSLICWINDGSHGLPDDIFIEQQDVSASKYFEVFKQIFEKMGHEAHFNMMFKDIHERESEAA